MGKKSWFSIVKKAIGPSGSKVKKDKRSQKSKSKKSNHGNEMRIDTCSSQIEVASLANPYPNPNPPEEMEFEPPENIEQPIDMDPISYATTATMEDVEYEEPHKQEEMDDVAPCASVEVNCIIPSPRNFLGKSREEIGAIKIQTAYRGYMAKKVFGALRARSRLTLLTEGKAVKSQTTSTLMRLQSESQLQTRKIQMVEVNEALQRQLLQKRQKGSEWDLTPKSKEQVEAILLRKKMAAERREKASAYAYSRQQTWRNSLKSTNPTLPNWEWNWSPWEPEPEPVNRQSLPATSPSKVSSQRLKSAKSTNASSRVKKVGPYTKPRVGSTNKPQLVSRSLSAGGKNSITKK